MTVGTKTYEDVAAELFGEQEFVTPYALRNLIEATSGKAIPAQMLYNYRAKGLLAAERVDGKWAVRAEVAVAFARKYGERNGDGRCE